LTPATPVIDMGDVLVGDEGTQHYPYFSV
jgi:hypothetical protein